MLRRTASQSRTQLKRIVCMQDCAVLLYWLAMDTKSQCVSHTMCWEEQPMALKSRVTILMQDLLSLLGYLVSSGHITSSCPAAVTVCKELCTLSCITVTSQSDRAFMLPYNLWVTDLSGTVFSGHNMYSQHHVWLVLMCKPTVSVVL